MYVYIYIFRFITKINSSPLKFMMLGRFRLSFWVSVTFPGLCSIWGWYSWETKGYLYPNPQPPQRSEGISQYGIIEEHWWLMHLSGTKTWRSFSIYQIGGSKTTQLKSSNYRSFPPQDLRYIFKRQQKTMNEDVVRNGSSLTPYCKGILNTTRSVHRSLPFKARMEDVSIYRFSSWIFRVKKSLPLCFFHGFSDSLNM